VRAFTSSQTVLRLSIDQLLGPVVLGRAARLHPTMIIFCFLSGGLLFGIAGMILAVPVALIPLDRALAVVPPQRERNGKYRHGASRSLMRRVGGVSANDMIQKLFQSQNAGTIKIDSMLVGGNLGFDSHSPWHIPGQTDGDGYIIVDRLRDGFGDTHHSEDRHAVAASHERPPVVTMGRLWGKLSKVVLPPDQLILSRKTSH